MTLKKIAELTGCSVATVSKAFSGSREISEETAKKIFDLSKKLGCYEKYFKGFSRTPKIGLLFPETESEYYGKQIGLLEEEISLRGADTIVGITRFDLERTARLFSTFAYGLKVDGIILVGGGKLIKNPDQLPLVSFHGIEGTENAPNADYLSIDYKGGIDSLVKLIKDYGHTRVGYIGERLTNHKQSCLHEALRKNGLPVLNKLAYTSQYRFAQAGEDGFAALLKGGPLPDVIVCAYDQIAYGAMSCAKRLGIKVPEDVSIVGIDDITANSFIDVPLTSLHIHLEDACKAVVDLLFKRIDNRNYRGRQKIIIPVSVSLRESLSSKKQNNCK